MPPELHTLIAGLNKQAGLGAVRGFLGGANAVRAGGQAMSAARKARAAARYAQRAARNTSNSLRKSVSNAPAATKVVTTPARAAYRGARNIAGFKSPGDKLSILQTNKARNAAQAAAQGMGGFEAAGRAGLSTAANFGRYASRPFVGSGGVVKRFGLRRADDASRLFRGRSSGWAQKHLDNSLAAAKARPAKFDAALRRSGAYYRRAGLGFVPNIARGHRAVFNAPILRRGLEADLVGSMFTEDGRPPMLSSVLGATGANGVLNAAMPGWWAAEKAMSGFIDNQAQKEFAKPEVRSQLEARGQEGADAATTGFLETIRQSPSFLTSEAGSYMKAHRDSIAAHRAAAEGAGDVGRMEQLDQALENLNFWSSGERPNPRPFRQQLGGMFGVGNMSQEDVVKYHARRFAMDNFLKK